MKKNLAKFIRILIVVFAIILCIIIMLVGFFIYELYYTNYREKVVDEQHSSDDMYITKLIAIGDPIDGFVENAEGKVILYKDDKVVSSQFFTVPNTSDPVSKSNWKLEWYDDRIHVTIYYMDNNVRKIASQYDMFLDGTIQQVPMNQWN